VNRRVVEELAACLLRTNTRKELGEVVGRILELSAHAK
jgi:hypothetical protein